MMLPREPRFVILGIPNDIDVTRAQLIFTSLGLVVAKRDIARRRGGR